MVGQLQSRVQDFVAAYLGLLDAVQSVPVNQPLQLVGNQTRLNELWRESSLKIDSQLRLSSDYNAIAFQDLSIDSSAVKAKVDGSINDLAGAMIADISGRWPPDWNVINQWLSAATGDIIQLSGSQSEPIS